MAGEFDFIEWVRQQQARSDFVQVPAGDDLAVLKWAAEDLLLVGVDQVLDGVHFDSSVHSPRAIGRKVMNRNLSDCAAMACLPAAAVATVALPKQPIGGVAVLDYAKELYLGLREAADPYDCVLVGGDTATWEGKLAITVTILGRSAGVAPITRSGARAGDAIYVSGPLGGSILGRHMTFTPRIEFARQLASLASVSAMIDISDGLSRDLRHICEQSRVGALIEADRVPIHPDAVQLAGRDGTSSLDHALHDGEDHELLFTLNSRTYELESDDVHAAVRAVVKSAKYIGRITADPAIELETRAGRVPLEPGGWEHKL